MGLPIEHTIITPDTLVKPRGYSHAVLTEIHREKGVVVAQLSLAGQTGSGLDGRILRPGDIVGQTEDTLSNMKTIADRVGVPLTFITGLRMDVTSVDAFKAGEREIGQLWREYFPGYYPPTTLTEAARLYDEEAMIELTGLGIVRLGLVEYAQVRGELQSTAPTLS